jgi:hypothetical protein
MLGQIVMLVLSIFVPLSVITSYMCHRNTMHHPLIVLDHLPDSIPIVCCHCILIYVWFYNQFIKPYLHQNSVTPIFQKHRHHRKHTRFQRFFLLYLIYTLTQLGFVTAVQQNKASLSTLLITPLLFVSCQCYNMVSSTPLHLLPSTTHTTIPQINKSASTSDKLSYLCAWSSVHASSSSLMNFTPGGKPICIDTGTSSCISNDKTDFIELTPSTDTFLKGISSGLNIESKGTLCWKITNDFGNEVSLHIHNSLYVPTAPMCLLSPQSVLQQTKKPSDGFQIYADKGIFRFSGYQKTIYYNTTNNLPIFFTSTDLTKTAISHATSLTIAAFLGSVEHTDNLSSLQRKLLQKHQQMGHLNMTAIQDLARKGFFGESNKSLANCDQPLCKACLHGKLHK